MSHFVTTDTTAIPLNKTTLDRLPENVSPPNYDRAALSASVMHFGVGGFHRAHQAVYFDELAKLGETDWAVIGVGIRRPEMGQVLAAQDHLFTVVERYGQESQARVIGSIIDYLLLAEDSDAVCERLRGPAIRLVTLTITGDGYPVEDDSDCEKSDVFAVIVDALDYRRRMGIPPFTILSCDNLPGSSEAARRAVIMIAAKRDPELVKWIEARVCFPSSMVDRITPGTTPLERDRIEAEFSIADRWPVTTERFSQWVIEDSFCNSRPPLDRVGARFVQDIEPYKRIKSRLLNGTHSALGYLGSLAGFERTDDAMNYPPIAEFVRRLTGEEICPLLPRDVAGMNLGSYRRQVINRLENSSIADPLSRLCRRGSTKMRDYLIPSLRQATIENRPRQLLTFVVASWLAYVQDAQSCGCDISDERATSISSGVDAILRGSALPAEFADLFGELCDDVELAGELRYWINMIRCNGMSSTLSTLLKGTS